jgi:hypothetical protein
MLEGAESYLRAPGFKATWKHALIADGSLESLIKALWLL